MSALATARRDLSAPRPWRAEPSDPRSPSSDWRVVASARPGSKPLVVASYLSEEDARQIATAPSLAELRSQLAEMAAALERMEEALAGAPADAWADTYQRYRAVRDAYDGVLERVSHQTEEPVPF